MEEGSKKLTEDYVQKDTRQKDGQTDRQSVSQRHEA